MLHAPLTLFSADLLSKWGFWDGDTPDAWMDYCDNEGIDHTKLHFPTAALVRAHLIPTLDQQVTAVDIETMHNPIRVDTVNGTDVTETWYGRAQAPLLTPELVDVPMPEVLRLVLAEAGLAEAPRATHPLT